MKEKHALNKDELVELAVLLGETDAEALGELAAHLKRFGYRYCRYVAELALAVQQQRPLLTVAEPQRERTPGGHYFVLIKMGGKRRSQFLKTWLGVDWRGNAPEDWQPGNGPVEI